MTTGQEAKPVQRSPRWRRLDLPGIINAVNPIAICFGPIFQKEVRILGRLKGTYWTRFSFTFIILIIITIAFLGSYQQIYNQSGIYQIQALQSLAPTVTATIMWSQFLLLAMLAPSATAGLICDERKHRTFPALLTTPLTAAQILLGKLSGRLVQLLILAIIPLPLLLALRIFGGVEAQTTFAAMAVAISIAILGAALGLVMSINARSAATASSQATIQLLALQGLLPLFLLSISSRTVSIDPAIIRMLCAPWVMTELTGQVLYGSAAGFAIWLPHVLYNLGLAAIVCLYGSVRLRRAMRDESVLSGELPARRRMFGLLPRKKTASDADQSSDAALSPKVKKQRQVGSQPIIWRELRQPTFDKRWKLIASILTVAALLAWLYIELDVSEEYAAHITVSIIAGFLMLLNAAARTASGITGERESRSWDVLMTTRLTNWDIIIGKLVGAIYRQWFIPAVLALHIVFAGVFSGCLHPIVVLHLTLILGGAVTMLCATGLCFSLIFKKSSTASALNLLFAVGFWALLPMFLGFIQMVTNAFGRGSSDWLFQAVLIPNPIFMVVIAIEGADVSAYSFLWESSLIYIMPHDTPGPAMFTFFVVLGLLAQLLIAAPAMALSATLFNRFAGRTS